MVIEGSRVVVVVSVLGTRALVAESKVSVGVEGTAMSFFTFPLHSAYVV